MVSKLTQYTLITATLIASAPSLAFEFDLNDMTNPKVSVEGCSYGRGSLAVESAKAEAAKSLQTFLNGEYQFSSEKYDETLVDTAFSSSSKSVLATALSQGRLALTYSSPMLMGDDTCVTATLAAGDVSSEEDFGDVSWDDSPIVSVIVTGEGVANKKLGLSARQAAEMDAFRRAISQVLGVSVKSGTSISSSSRTSTTESNDSASFEDISISALSISSSGVVDSWSEISSQALANGRHSVTLNVNVTKATAQEKFSQMMAQIGNPKVFVDGDNASIVRQLSDALRGLGYTTTSRVSNAALWLDINTKAFEINNESRLEMSISVRDLAGNHYGSWENDPSFMALPTRDGVTDTLAKVTLRSKKNQKAIQSMLESSANALAQMGGPVREILMSNSAAGDHANLNMLISRLHSVSDVQVSKKGKQTLVTFRSVTPIGDVAHLLSSAMKVHRPNKTSRVVIENDFRLTVN
ncbi:hypothetical protein LRP49_06345 [Enterovibrio sp. ZSDZ35]|uniref:Flagellar assembly protein T N-terminal domain-containing protein n=1 Tax=Enterovibrio qingdaonensis TaxID=2899818 RepID=A0ABT5QIK2_9GAMM|nr:hypothetical protein [Enterovibrio sp. ZSDZ35]MDD1780818.1 hypothetical protein [Enterovibrio sp. ZSDZ35]